MKNSAFLALMEQMIMTLVFALAAVLCLQVFILSEQMSLQGEVQSHALTATQTAAETLKGSYGDLNHCADLLGGFVQDNFWKIQYDDQWKPTEIADMAAYELLVYVDSSPSELLQSAKVTTQTTEGKLLISLSVSWQEVDSRG